MRQGVDVSVWKPGDSGILPEVDESCYPPDAEPLEPLTKDEVT